jgi:peptidoglycan/xylan/chitin deacetylase (PgdA/CDA1 family)
MSSLPVLLYHSVDDDPPAWLAPYTVTKRVFVEQLNAIVDSGRVPVSASQIVDARTGGLPLPPNAIAVTFDDGFRDFAENALPELLRRKLPVTLFVTTGALAPVNRSLLPSAAMLTADQLTDLDWPGIEIGSHTHWHSQLDVLDRTSVIRELTRSKEVLEQILEHEVDLFAYPHGTSSPEVRNLTRLVGYRGAFAVRNGFSPVGDDPFRIARLMVRADVSQGVFAGWLRGEAAPVSAPHERVRTTAYRHYRRGVARFRDITGV